MAQTNFSPVSRRVLTLAVVLGAIALGACATPPTDPAARAEFEKTNDPFEPTNRKILDVNLFLDRVAIKPVAQAYVDYIPEVGRNAVHHFLDNLGEPIVFANNLLQGQFERAGDTFARFMLNSTAGLAGIRDLAAENGLEKQSGDFGQTLYSWGVPAGPYIVIPILGPSDPRDAIGDGIDAYGDPFNQLADLNGYWYLDLTRGVVNGIDERARNLGTLDELQRNAIDFYAELRSLWRQHRDSVLRHGQPAPIPDLDSLYQDPALTPASAQMPPQTAKK
jgi:phospholipid-binding lipoprotein MlaA